MMLAHAAAGYSAPLFASPTVVKRSNTSCLPVGPLEWPPPAPLAHVVKDLSAATAADCEAACISYHNERVSPVSGWTRCLAYTWLPQPKRCSAVVDAGEISCTTVVGASAGVLTWPPRACDSSASCSYNGECVETLCRCDTAWQGDRCQTLALQPAKRGAGYRAIDGGQNTSSWGGAVLVDKDGVHHMWASEMTHHCGIDSWTSNSRIVHATSRDGVTFARREVVHSAFAHEPNVVRAPTGEWVMYFTSSEPGASPPPPCSQCANGQTLANTTCPGGPGGTGPTFMSVAPAPDGPWSAPTRLFGGAQAQRTNMDTNLAVVLLPNGSAIGIGRTGGAPQGIDTHLVTADDWRNASSYVGRWETLLFPDTRVVPDAGLEDPSVYLDARGIFHAVFHNQIEADDERLCGGHAYSVDGLAWTFTGTAWSNRVRFDDGSTYVFSRRERPHLVFGDSRAPTRITALTTGVQYGEGSPRYAKGQDACYTLLQPVE